MTPEEKIASIDAEIAEVESILAGMSYSHVGIIDWQSLQGRIEILKEKRSKYMRTTNGQNNMENITT